jgi:hypothetical protein
VLPIAELTAAAERYFDAGLWLLSESQVGAETRAQLLFESKRFGPTRFTALPRAALATDYDLLESAQAANNSWGMADLGRRCPSVWEVTMEGANDPTVLFYFGALLASVALGPLLVEEYPGLYGVRSARLKSASES